MNRKIREALKEARDAGRIKCDKLAFYEDPKGAPILHRGSIQGVPGHLVVAWRGERYVYEWIAEQLLEHAKLDMVASVICKDLDKALDQLCP